MRRIIMAIKKSDLYSKLWKSADSLRGGMDSSQYKDYILVLLFMRYVTDKHYGKSNAMIVVPEGGSYHDLVALKGKKEIGDLTNKVIHKMAEENDLIGVITVADFNDEEKLGKGKELVDRLTDLIAIFEDDALDFSSNQATDDDILGDAFEYLMRNFATESGKSKGQFYTPAEVSRIMAKVIGIGNDTERDQTIYDPTAGSGSLLLKAADEAPRGLTIYGQERDVSTVALAKMNMILHNNETADIKQGDTITSPEFTEDGSLMRFDFSVSNPPFSTKSWSSGIDPTNDAYERFSGFGIPPAKNGDYAFFLHFLKSIKSTGKGAIILPHGVLFRGNVEAQIRQSVIERGVIKGIIGMPANLFYGTGIPAAIIVLDKEDAHTRKGIFIIDASDDFIKDGNKNRLREQDVHKVVDVFNEQIEIEGYSRMVPVHEIEQNDFNLNIPRYIDRQEEEDIQDITAHLHGGIPEGDLDTLQEYWDVYPTVKETLFKAANQAGYYELKVQRDDIKETIYHHPEFKTFKNGVLEAFNSWKGRSIIDLKNIDENTAPKQMILELSEAILASFADQSLINHYDIYQYVMNYWFETMRDDVYMIVENDWMANDDLTPADLFITRYFTEEEEEINLLTSEIAQFEQEQTNLLEEHNEEDNVFEDTLGASGKVTKGNLNKKLKELKDDPEEKEDYEVLLAYKKLDDQISKLKKEIKTKKDSLTGQINEKYRTIRIEELKEMIVDDKWLRAIENDINDELNRVSQRLTSRIEELAERYAHTLPKLEQEHEALFGKVNDHLKRMGFEW